MSRDWSKAFGPASYKGTNFHVEVESAAGGKRVSKQYAAYGGYVSEEFGSKARNLPSQIYLASDTVDFEMNNLLRVFESSGPGLLRLPMQGAFLVHLIDFNMNRKKLVNGYVPCSVQFLPVGSSVSTVGFSFNAGLAAFKGMGQKIGGRIGQGLSGL